VVAFLMLAVIFYELVLLALLLDWTRVLLVATGTYFGTCLRVMLVGLGALMNLLFLANNSAGAASAGAPSAGAASTDEADCIPLPTGGNATEANATAEAAPAEGAPAEAAPAELLAKKSKFIKAPNPTNITLKQVPK
jgi:hypothetical protein